MSVLAPFERICEPIPHAKSPNRMRTKFYDGDTLVACLRWRTDAAFVEVLNIRVHENYQRRGIATAIYDQLRSETGLRLKWIRNAMSGDMMKEFAKQYIAARNGVESDDGNTIVLRPLGSAE